MFRDIESSVDSVRRTLSCSSEEWTSVYTTIYSYANRVKDSVFYAQLVDLLTNRVKHIDMSSHSMLSMCDSWREWTTAMRKIDHMFVYFNTRIVEVEDRLPIYALALDMWRIHVLEGHVDSFIGEVALSMDKSRRGEDTDLQLLGVAVSVFREIGNVRDVMQC